MLNIRDQMYEFRCNTLTRYFVWVLLLFSFEYKCIKGGRCARESLREEPSVHISVLKGLMRDRQVWSNNVTPFSKKQTFLQTLGRRHHRPHRHSSGFGTEPERRAKRADQEDALWGVQDVMLA